MNDDRSARASGRRSGGNSRRVYALALLFMGLLVVAAWVGRDRFRPVTVGDPAPDFVAHTLEGEEVSLDDYRGRVVLVNVWATWCAPCREEMPSMERLYQAIGDDDFEIVAVSVDAAPGERDDRGQVGPSKAKLREFAEEFGLTFTILHDPEGRIETLFQTTGVPESFLIDREGVIVRKVAGATFWDHANYQDLVQRLLAG